VAINFFLSVCLSARNISSPTGGIFTDFDILFFFENLLRIFTFHYNLTTITGTLHADRYTFLIISRSVLLRMRNVSDNTFGGNQNTFYILAFFANLTVQEIM